MIALGALIASAGIAVAATHIAVAATGIAVASSDTIASSDAPVPMLPQDLRWTSPPNNAAARGAWVVGTETASGPYLFRVTLAAGGRIPPHTHPDARNTTVLSGTLFVGFGTTFDEAKLVRVPTGAVYVAPAGTPHYVAARDGEVVYQEAGVGPTATVPASVGPTATVPVER